MHKKPGDINAALKERITNKSYSTLTRSEYDVDSQRILFSDAFRRLQSKTQVLQLSESDFHRTRLTHSVEVASIAKSIFNNVEKSLPSGISFEPSLAEAIGYAHDIGHPPFGHGGEIALNYMMAEYGGFEGNGQTLRILSKLGKYSNHDGMNLTRRSILGILKYPCSYHTVNRPKAIKNKIDMFHTLNQEQWKPPKCYFDCDQDIVDWALIPFSTNDRELFTHYRETDNDHAESLYKTFDCSIMDLADDIAYSMHDFEDAFELGLIGKDHLNHVLEKLKKDNFFLELLTKAKNQNFSDFKDKVTSEIKHFISIMIGYFIQKSEIYLLNADFESAYLKNNVRLPESTRISLDVFYHIISEQVINSHHNKIIEKNGQIMICYLFDAFINDCQLMPPTTQEKYKKDDNNPRVICDYISGMTDHYAIKMYKRIFGSDKISYFEK